MKNFKEYRGYYYDEEGENLYVDITEYVSEFLELNNIKQSLIEIEPGFNGERLYNYDNYKKFIDNNIVDLNQYIKRIKNNSHCIDFDALGIYIEFNTGTIIYINSSEWGSIKKI